jgi:MFS family permease
MSESVSLKSGALESTPSSLGPQPLQAFASTGSLTGPYPYYVVAVIWLVMLLRLVDLQIIAVLLEPIRTEFKLSDTTLGLLSGTAFAFFYGTLGIPMAWVADRYNRRNLIAACLLLWSATTALCGMAGSAIALFFGRLGTGLGEAGGIPPSYSLTSDYFPAARRASIIAILNSAVPAGVFASYLIGGYINERLGWRATFISVGIFGALVALLVKLTVREPARGIQDGLRRDTRVPAVMETVAFLWRIRSYRHFVLASTLLTLGAMGSGIWIAAFFIRVHGMPPREVATALAFVYGIGGVAGATLGGILCDRVVRKTGDARWYGWFSGAVSAAILPLAFFVYLWPNPITALLVQTGTAFLMHSWMGPCYGTIQSLVGASQRAMAAAVNLLVVNLLAIGLGPLIVGAVSDFMNARFAGESLRYSILAVVVVAYGWAAVHFILAARSLREDLASAKARLA